MVEKIRSNGSRAKLFIYSHLNFTSCVYSGCVQQFVTFPIRNDALTQTVKLKSRVVDVQSQYQRIEIFDTEAFGRVLLLDGHIQLSELDERAYHEALVHVPLINIRDPKKALIIGGGDGGVLREILRNPSIERADMVEIDAEVIAACREHLPAVSDGAFEDPRANVIVGDAFEFVQKAEGSYDLIVIDSTDTYEGEDGALSERLFTDSFYSDIQRLLSPKGFAVTQADNVLFCPYSLEGILASFQEIFPRTGWYFAIVPSFGGFSGFAWGGCERPISSRYAAVPAPIAGLKTLTPEAYDYGMIGLRYG